MTTRAAIWLLAVLAILFPACVGKSRQAGQDCLNCLIVDGPRISRTAFTNWESIELAYTVRWLDGYEPVKDDLKPEAMNFGILELDPEFSEESDIRNERKFENENFFDIVYHLRYMGEKKGEIIVPGQRFPYRSIEAGSQEVKYFPTPEFKLAYNTVLTSDAEDIKEEFDPGSYQRTAMFWKMSAALVVLLGIAGGFLLVFFRPKAVELAEEEKGRSKAEAGANTLEPASVIRELRSNIAKGDMSAVCNGLGDLIRVYVPDIAPGSTSKDMTAPILAVRHEWERDRLLRAHKVLRDVEEYLFADASRPVPTLEGLDATIKELRPRSVYWRRRWFNLKQRTARPFVYLKGIRAWRKPWRR